MIWTSLLEPLDTHPATSYVGHMPSEHLTAKQAAERLGVDVRTIHRAVAAGRLAPVFKGTGLRGAYVFTVDAVDALAEGEAAS